jgi:hypothetical protein
VEWPWRLARPLILALSALLGAGSAAPAPASTAEKEALVARSVAALRANACDEAALSALRRAFTETFPATLPADVATYLPVPHQLCEDRVRADAPPQRGLILTGLAFPDAAHRQDPVSRQVFNRVLHGYVQAADDEWRLAFRVLYNDRQEGAERLAPRAMRALLRVRAAATAMVGDPRRVLQRPIALWIRADGNGGAAQSGPNLYLLGAAEREPLELLRQVAHEFGHLFLPGIGPLTDPEEWGNGFLGEMLILRWLARAADAADAPVPREALAAYLRQEAEPLARAFAAAGWGALVGHERSTGGLRLLLGMVLHLEDTRGTEAVGMLLRTVRGTAITDWAAAGRPLLSSLDDRNPVKEREPGRE